jgi:hypothetical protein
VRSRKTIPALGVLHTSFRIVPYHLQGFFRSSSGFLQEFFRVSSGIPEETLVKS